MDVDDDSRHRSLIERLDSSAADLRIVCIPACMHDGYFGGGKHAVSIGERWKSKIVVLANMDSKEYAGCSSFMTNTAARVIESFPGAATREQNKIVLRPVLEIV
jgi:hypothetical protein